MNSQPPKRDGLSLGLDAIFTEDDDNGPLDLSGFKPSPRRKDDDAEREQRRQRAMESGFQDRGGASKAVRRAPKPANKTAPAEGPQRRSAFYLTGRNAQLNMKVLPEDRDRLRALCERQNWVAGQALQYALDALEEKIAAADDPFWKDRNLNGVD